jgi:hypothetical protein
MRNILATLAALAMMSALAAPAIGATETVTGKIVDQSCYLKDKVNNSGANHKMPADVTDCAIACAKMGRALALLTTDGKVYAIEGGLAANKNEKLVGHVSHTVSITGDVTTKPDGGMAITADALKMVSR